MLFNKKQTIPKFRRIRSGGEYRLILGEYCCSNKWFVGYARENNIGVSRLGLIVSKKVAPTAVKRNFAKRLIREVFRQEFPARCAQDIVIRLRCPLSQETSGIGRGALIQLLGRIQKNASVLD